MGKKACQIMMGLFCALIMSGCGGGSDVKSDVTRYRDLAKAKEISKTEKKPLIVYFFQVENNACREFEAEVLVRKTVIDASEETVWVEVNGALNPEIAQEYGVFALPTILLMTPGGEKELDRIVDVPTPEELVERLGMIKAGRGKATETLAKESANPEDLKSVYDAGVVWRDRGRMPDEAVPRFRKVYDKDFDNKLGLGSKALLQLAFADLLTRNPIYVRQAIQKLEILVQRYPTSKEAPNALLGMAAAYQALDDKDAALSAFDRIISTYPNTEEAKQAENNKNKMNVFEDTVRAFLE
jgi:hypothetical protein